MYSLEEIRDIQRGMLINRAPLINLSYKSVLEAYCNNEIDYDAYSYLLLVSSRAGLYI